MGGIVPYGYRAEDKKLVIDGNDAEQVRYIFRRYLELRSVDAVVRELNTAQTNSAADNADEHCGRTATPQSRGKIYYLLSNPVYIGKIRHKEDLHDGEHEAIIETETFDTVQALLAKQAASPRGSAVRHDNHLLTGRVCDEHGNRLMSGKVDLVRFGENADDQAARRQEISNAQAPLDSEDGWRRLMI